MCEAKAFYTRLGKMLLRSFMSVDKFFDEDDKVYLCASSVSCILVLLVSFVLRLLNNVRRK